MHVCWFRFHRFVSGVKPFFGIHQKMRAGILTMSTLTCSVHLCLYLVTSLSQLSNLSSPLLQPGVGGRICSFLVVPHLCKRFETYAVFLVIFNYRSLLPVVCKAAASSFAWLIHVSCPFVKPLCAFSSYNFFLLSPFLRKLSSRSLYKLDLPYHFTRTLRVRVDLGVMALPRSPVLKPHHQV